MLTQGLKLHKPSNMAQSARPASLKGQLDNDMECNTGQFSRGARLGCCSVRYLQDPLTSWNVNPRTGVQRSLAPTFAPAFPPVHEGHVAVAFAPSFARARAPAHPTSHLLRLIPSCSQQLDLLRRWALFFLGDFELAMAALGAKTWRQTFKQ